MNTTHAGKKYSVVALGGTFDHFHQGHAWFLQQAALLSDRLIIGITTEILLKHKAFASSLESYDQRADNVAAFLNQHKISHELIPLQTVEGPTLTDKRIEAVVVTEETAPGGKLLNEKRLAAGWPTLPIELVPLFSNDSTVIVSSQNIRSGRSNRAGSLYELIFKQPLRLTDKQRQAMRVVQGQLVETPDQTDGARYLVGDSTLGRFLDEQQRYDLAVIDGKIQREQYFPLVIDKSLIDISVTNPAGSITTALVKVLQLALIKQMKHIFVDGEEDLAAVVLQLLLPLGSTIYYGQPDTGLVRWPVTEAQKEKTAQLLSPHFQTNPKLIEYEHAR